MSPASTRFRPVPWFRFGWVLTLAALLHASARANDSSRLAAAKAAYQVKLETLRQTHAEQTTSALSQKYCTLLSKGASTAQSEGKLAEYLAVQKEIERFQSSGIIEEQDIDTRFPRIARTQRSALKAFSDDRDKLRQAESDLARSYLEHLEKLKAHLTRQNQIDQALDVDREITAFRLAQDSDAPAPPTSASRPADRPAPASVRPAHPAPSRPLVMESVPEDRLVVMASDNQGPAANVEISLRSHSFNKSFRGKTDRKGRADFAILPELDYCILVLDPRYEPVILEQCSGGTAYALELQAVQDGFRVVETGIAGDVRLPGLSPFRISGSYNSGSGSGIVIQPSSPRTVFDGLPVDQDRIRLNFDTLVTVNERSSRIELKVLSPVPDIRLFLYRDLPPDPAREAAARNDSCLRVETRSGGYPVKGVLLELFPDSGQPMSAKTDRTGVADFTVNPALEYTLLANDKRYLPVILPHVVGGDPCPIDLQPLPSGMAVITLDGGSELKLPGISPLQLTGYSHAVGQILAVSLKATSPKTAFSGHPSVTERITLDIDEWLTVTEGSKTVEFKVLAPDKTRRIILHRKPL